MTTLHLNKNTLTKTEFIKWNIGCHLQKSAENLGKMGRGLYFFILTTRSKKRAKKFFLKAPKSKNFLLVSHHKPK